MGWMESAKTRSKKARMKRKSGSQTDESEGLALG